VGIPREGHEYIRDRQQKDGLDRGHHPNYPPTIRLARRANTGLEFLQIISLILKNDLPNLLNFFKS
jgi:hypothetical protein